MRKMANRRANHEGSKPIRRADGRYQCRVVISGEATFFTGVTASIAREKMRAWLRLPVAAISSKTQEHADVASLLDAYLKRVKDSKADKTYRSYESIVRQHIKPRIGSINPKKITAGHITSMLDDMKNSPIAIAGKPKHGKPKRLIGARTRELTYIVTRAALKSVGPDLFANVDKPKAKAEEMHPWTSLQASSFLRYVDEIHDTYQTLYRVALRTGARKGELLALRVTDFDAAAGVIRINKSYNEKLQEDGPTKTSSSRRSLALSPETVAAIKRHIMATGVRGDDRVFPAGDIRVLSKRMQRVMRAAGVPVIRFHDLRHTFATLALKTLIPIKVVSEILGHSSVKTTLDIYAHTLPGMHESAVTALEAAF